MWRLKLFQGGNIFLGILSEGRRKNKRKKIKKRAFCLSNLRIKGTKVNPFIMSDSECESERGVEWAIDYTWSNYGLGKNM